MRHPRLAQNLPSEAARVSLHALPRVFQVRRIGTLNLERVRGGAETHDRSAAIEIVHDVTHLGVRKILKAQEDHQEIRGAEDVETLNVRAAWFDEAGLRIGRDEHAATEAVAPREDACER